MSKKRSMFFVMTGAFLIFGLYANKGETAGPCTSIPGVWSWFANGDVTFSPNGGLTQGPRTGRWNCQNGYLTIVWSHGYTDRLVLANDGRTMSGTNQNGNAISGTRRDAASSQPAMVFENCRVTPCVLGVADPGYAVPGNQRYAEGWRPFNTNPYPLTAFPDELQAWRFACRIHYSNPRYRAPDIVSGRINCAAICGGNPRCP
ncbi:MAG: hypothetical protein AB1585_06730 [Thermodesulfobacteriota bacterium]